MNPTTPCPICDSEEETHGLGCPAWLDPAYAASIIPATTEKMINAMAHYWDSNVRDERWEIAYYRLQRYLGRLRRWRDMNITVTP